MAASPWPIPRRWPLATSRRARCHCPTRRLKKKNGNQQLYNSFYFVSDSSEVINLLFFPFSSPFFSNLQISAILMIFLSRMDGLLLKYDMVILYSENLSGFRFFPRYVITMYLEQSSTKLFYIKWAISLFILFSQSTVTKTHRFIDMFEENGENFW